MESGSENLREPDSSNMMKVVPVSHNQQLRSSQDFDYFLRCAYRQESRMKTIIAYCLAHVTETKYCLWLNLKSPINRVDQQNTDERKHGPPDI